MSSSQLPATTLEVNGWTLALSSDLTPESRHVLSQIVPDLSSASISASLRVVPGDRLLLHMSNPRPAGDRYELEMAVGLTGKRTACLSFDLSSAQSPDKDGATSGPPIDSAEAGRAASLWLDGSGAARKVALGAGRGKDDAGKIWVWLELGASSSCLAGHRVRPPYKLDHGLICFFCSGDCDPAQVAIEGLFVLRLYQVSISGSKASIVPILDNREACIVLSDSLVNVSSTITGARPSMDVDLG